jgi:DNA-binding GntR family transcriptional regulator
VRTALDPSALFLSRRRTTISVQIHQRLRARIVAGELVPRQTLSENELAASLGVSRTPVREALGKLEEDGLIQIIPQYGTFVAPIVPEHVYGNQFIREALECASLGAAAARCTESDARQLRALVARQRAADSDAVFFQADEAMHCMLMAIGGQEHAWQVVETAKLHLDRVRHLAVRSTMKRRSIIKEHNAIIDCVVAGDAIGATAAMRAHLRGIYASINAVMREHPQFFSDVTTDARPARRPAGAQISEGEIK